MLHVVLHGEDENKSYMFCRSKVLKLEHKMAVGSLIMCSDCITCLKLQKQKAQAIVLHLELRLPILLLLQLSLFQPLKLKQD